LKSHSAALFVLKRMNFCGNLSLLIFVVRLSTDPLHTALIDMQPKCLKNVMAEGE
jgi:hypothetical protein